MANDLNIQLSPVNLKTIKSIEISPQILIKYYVIEKTVEGDTDTIY